MIKTITVINNLGEKLKLDLMKPEESGFIVESIDGLGPEKANINFTEVATGDGSFYDSARLPNKNIVINLRFYWKDNMSIEDLRQLSYKYFPIKKNIKLRIETDNKISEIEGHVESNEPNIFSDAENTSISIICMNPYFKSVSSNETIFSGLDKLFEFPFCNDSLSEPLLEMSEYRHLTKRNVVYEGDGDVGINIFIDFLGPVSDIAIYNTTQNEKMTINLGKVKEIVGSEIKPGDRMEICTCVGSKSIKLIRDGIEYNIIHALSKDSSWFHISNGDNVFSYAIPSGIDNVKFKIENDLLYGGI